MPNVYDFDNTIVCRDSGQAFISFCIERYRWRMLRFLPGFLVTVLRFDRDRRRGRPVKGEFFAFTRMLPDVDAQVRLFWRTHADTLLKPWYLAQKRPDDIVVSCSPEFLLRPLCDQLGVRLVCTRFDTRRGRVLGWSCYGDEKVRRLREAFGDIEINEFYSDSVTDAPLAALAKRAFLVTGDVRAPWPEEGDYPKRGWYN